MILPPGVTSVIKHVFLQDSTVTTGAGKTALAFGDITAYYVRAGGTLTALTLETIATLGTWASGGDNHLGFKKLDDTNAPGVYEIHLPNNILAAGANQVTIQLRAAGAAPCNIEIQLRAVPAQVTSQDNIDFGALQKASLNAATPASVQNIPATGSGFTALGDTRIANLDAAVSSRSTLTAQQVWEYTTRTLSSFGTLAADVATAVWGAGARTLTSFGTLAADAAAAVWASVTRSLTDKAGFTISGAKTTLDALQDLSQAGAQAGSMAALNAYDPPTKAEMESAVSPLALEATLTAIKGGGWSTQTLVAISALVDDLEGRLTVARAGYLDELAPANIPADIDTLLARLTAPRAGYLDNLSAGPVALEANVQTHAAAALTAYDPPTKAELDDAQAAIETAINHIVVPPPEGVALETTLTAMKGAGWTDETLKSIKAAVLAQAGSGTGAITWTYTLTRSDNGLPIADAEVWVTTDLAGVNVIASGRTDQNGVLTFRLDAGPVYVWRKKTGFNFVNPDLEVVS